MEWLLEEFIIDFVLTFCMRLFVAIDLDDPEYFSSMQEGLRKVAGAKMTFPSSYHITLKFLGEVDDAKKGKIAAALSSIKFGAFDLRCDHLGVFPSEREIRVVWAGFAGAQGAGADRAFKEGYDSVVRLQKQIDSALKPMGFDLEKTFVPHVTLCRVKSLTPEGKKNISEHLKKMKVEPLRSVVRSFSLIKSTLGREGPAYETITTVEAEERLL